MKFVNELQSRAMKKWQFWFGVLISILFIWLALRGLRLEEFWESVKQANYWWLLPGVAVYFVGVWVRAWRWHYLLGPIKKIPTKTMFPITTIGYMGNNIYPARAGEVLRAVILKRREGVPVSASLATIIVERIFDGVVMLAFVFVNLPELARLTDASGFVGNIQQVAVIGTGVFLGALGVFLLAAMFPQVTARAGLWGIEHFTPKRLHTSIIGIMNKFLDGLASLRSPFNVLMVFFTSVIIWLLETGKYWFVMHAFPFEVSFFALMLMNGIVNLATTIPSAPGYIGTFDAPGIAVLVAYGVDQATAAGYTLVLHVALWLPITLLGAYYLAREGIKWSNALRAEVDDMQTPITFSNNDEFYAFIESLIEKLKEEKQFDWATKIENALRISALPGEIFGELRLRMIELQQTDIPSRLGIKHNIRIAIKTLDDALK
jgi:uncharacterized protein (TIRG00374 family)